MCIILVNFVFIVYNDSMLNLERQNTLIGKNKSQNIKKKHICICGLGGVGGMALEVLARAGVETFTLIDDDIFEETNLNRQILSLHSTLNQEKTYSAYKRLKDINPNIKTFLFNHRITLETKFNEIFSNNIDFVFDCIDSVQGKIALIKYLTKEKIKFISSMGAGQRFDASKTVICRFKEVQHCPLAKKIRKELKKGEEILPDFMCVSSTETPIKGKNIIGSYAPVVLSFGLLGASHILNHFISENTES